MSLDEIITLIRTRSANAASVATRNDHTRETYSHEEHWQIMSLVLNDLANYIEHNSTN